jgi:hypothetical protein
MPFKYYIIYMKSLYRQNSHYIGKSTTNRLTYRLVTKSIHCRLDSTYRLENLDLDATGVGESFLSVVWSLVPKVMVVAEQEASHNDASFRRRFAGAQHYNVAMYNSVAATAHRCPARSCWRRWSWLCSAMRAAGRAVARGRCRRDRLGEAGNGGVGRTRNGEDGRNGNGWVRPNFWNVLLPDLDNIFCFNQMPH